MVEQADEQGLVGSRYGTRRRKALYHRREALVANLRRQGAAAHRKRSPAAKNSASKTKKTKRTNTSTSR